MRPIPDFSLLSDYVFHHAGVQPEQEAMVFAGQRIRYQDLARDIRSCARGLLAKGLARGDRVAMLSTPRPEHVVVFLATTMIGGIWIGLNPRHRGEELGHVIDDAKPRILFSICEFRERSYRQDLAQLKAEFDFLQTIVTLDEAISGLSTDYSDFLRSAPLDAQAADRLEQAERAVETNDAAVVIYTSGSTGRSKGAVLSHRSLIVGYSVQYEHWPASPLRTINNLPINHIASLGDLTTFSLMTGGTIVFMDHFSAADTLELLEREKITFLQQFPTQLQLILDVPRFPEFDLSSLQIIAWGGASASRDLVRRLGDIGARLYNSYGMTECGAPILFTDDGAGIDILAETVGRPDPRFSVRIVDQAGQPVPPGQAGEIQLRGEIMMLGYLNRPEETAEVFSFDGWFRSGDVAVCLPDGNFKLVGRLKEMFKSGGYSIFPREIEMLLERHPIIATAVVIAVPDPLYQEVGCAFLLAKPESPKDLSDVIGYARARLANYKIPKRFEFVDRLPLLPNGKIDRQSLLARAIGAD